MLLRILCAVFLLSGTRAFEVKGGTKANLTAAVPSNITTTVRTEVITSNDTRNALVDVTTTQAPTTTSLPKLSGLDKYLLTQRSFVLVREGEDDSGAAADVQNVMSPNYPMPYPTPRTIVQRLAVENSSGINVVINDLDIDPNKDYISIVPIYGNGTEGRPVILTGKLSQPFVVRSLGYTKANLIFAASTSEGHAYRGFSISYSPYGEVQQAVTQPPDVTLAYDQLETISKLLVIPKDNQTNETWKRLKQLFANATNSYVNTTNQTLEQALPTNITLTRVANCFDSWPETRDCAEVEFAITLYNDTKKTPSVDPYLVDLTPRKPAGLSKSQLDQMWKLYGRALFEKEGIVEYELPDTRTRILMWIGIAIGSCVLLFLIFVAVFRSPAFRDRWVEDDTVAIKNNEENNRSGNYDVTIYPSPDQVIPEMYPGSQNGGTNGHVPPPPEGRIRTNTFETINEAYTEDEAPTTRM